MHVNWTEIPAVYLGCLSIFVRLRVRVVLYCMCMCAQRAQALLCVCVCVRFTRLVSYYSRNGLQRFGGYLFLLVNCGADLIEGLGQFKWAFSQITSVIVCVRVPQQSHQDTASEALKFSKEGQSDPSFRRLTL